MISHNIYGGSPGTFVINESDLCVRSVASIYIEPIVPQSDVKCNYDIDWGDSNNTIATNLLGNQVFHHIYNEPGIYKPALTVKTSTFNCTTQPETITNMYTFYVLGANWLINNQAAHSISVTAGQPTPISIIPNGCRSESIQVHMIYGDGTYDMNIMGNEDLWETEHTYSDGLYYAQIRCSGRLFNGLAPTSTSSIIVIHAS